MQPTLKSHYLIQLDQANSLIAALRGKIREDKKKMAKNPNDWGYLGNLCRINALLREAVNSDTY